MKSEAQKSPQPKPTGPSLGSYYEVLEGSKHLIIKTVEGRRRCSLPHMVCLHALTAGVEMLQDSKQERMMNGTPLRWGKR